MNDGFCTPSECPRILKAILDRSGDAMIRADLDGMFVGWSPGARRLYGYSEAEAVGASASLLIPPERRSEFTRILGEVRAGRAVNDLETVRLTKDGRHLNVLLSALPVLDESNQPVSLLSFARDLTALRRSESAYRASEAKWRAIIDSAVDGIIVIDSRGTIESFNAAAERLFGYSADDVVGQSVNVLMPPPHRDEHDGYLSRYLAGGPAKIIGVGREITARRRNGEEFPARLAVAEASVDGQRRFTGIVHDLTARLEMERRLREQTALARIGGMTAIVAHEVRNALAAVRGTIEVVSARLPRDSREAVATSEAVGRIDALTHIVQDMAFFAHLPEPRLHPVDLVQLVMVTVQVTERDPLFQGITTEVLGTMPSIPADEALLKVVLLNLLTNSAQAMSGKGVIHVVLEATDCVGRITVIDRGPGIAAEAREKMFTPFFTTKSRGSGLGLATAKRIVEAHHGELRLESPAEAGTRAVIELPLAGPALKGTDLQ